MMTLMLACTMQQVDPHMGTNKGPATQSTVHIENSEAVASGMPGLADKLKLQATTRRSKVIDLRGAKTALGFDTWATLTPRRGGVYEMEWQMIGEYARNGRHSVAVWQTGTCMPSAQGGIQ